MRFKLIMKVKQYNNNSLLKWSPDGKLLLFGLLNGEIQMYDNTGNLIVSDYLKA